MIQTTRLNALFIRAEFIKIWVQAIGYFDAIYLYIFFSSICNRLQIYYYLLLRREEEEAADDDDEEKQFCISKVMNE